MGSQQQEDRPRKQEDRNGATASSSTKVDLGGKKLMGNIA